MTNQRHSIEIPGMSHGGNPIPMGSRVGPLVCSSAIMGTDRTTGQIPEDGPEQVRIAFENLDAFVRAAGIDLGDIARVGVLLADASLRAQVNEQWEERFPDPESRPARHTTVRELPNRMVIQLEILAFASAE